MDFDTLERLWRSESNNRATVAEAYLMEATLKVLIRRRLAIKAGLALIGLGLSLWTCAVLYAVLTGRISNLRQEWGIVVLLSVSWLAFLWALVQQQRHLNAHPHPTATMPDVLRALIDENRMAQARTRMMAGALIVFTAVLSLCLWQLHAVGKMEMRHVVQGSILFGAALGLSVVIHTIRYVRWLKPEEAQLCRLLSEYESNA